MMTKLTISLILAAGVAAFVYSKMGKRIGYTNTKKLWMVIAASFIVAFGIIILTISLFIHK